MQNTIGEWTPELLTKWLRDIFLTQPPGFLPNLKSERLTVSNSLTVQDKIVMAREPEFRRIGSTGSPPFEHSWVNFDAGWQVAGFWRDGFGWVHLRGLIKSGTVGSAAFTLPPGYRPKLSEAFGVDSNSAYGRVEILADGSVIPKTPSNNAYVSLSNIRFRTS